MWKQKYWIQVFIVRECWSTCTNSAKRTSVITVWKERTRFCKKKVALLSILPLTDRSFKPQQHIRIGKKMSFWRYLFIRKIKLHYKKNELPKTILAEEFIERNTIQGNSIKCILTVSNNSSCFWSKLL